MGKSDQLHRFVFESLDIRGQWVKLEHSYSQALQAQSHPAAVRCLLGEFMAAAALLSNTLKFEGSLILHAKGMAQLRLLIAECTNQQGLRAMAQCLDHFDASQPLLGQGQLMISIEPKQGQRYQGVVAIDEPCLARVVQTYFQQSEQLPTLMQLQANDHCVAGLLIQALPHSGQHGDAQASAEHWSRIEQLTATLSPTEMLTLDSHTVLHRLYHQERIKIFDPSDLYCHCTCSAQRSAQALFALGEADARTLLAEQQGCISVDCQFCGQGYRLQAADIDRLFRAESL